MTIIGIVIGGTVILIRHTEYGDGVLKSCAIGVVAGIFWPITLCVGVVKGIALLFRGR